jgi:hypothetical protein
MLWGAHRMKALMFLAVALMAMCLAGVTVEPLRGAGDQNQTLIELEKRWLEAEDDPSVLEGILADDFVHVLPFGFVTKAEQLRYMRTHPSPQARPARHFEDLKVRVYGNAGIVNGIVVSISREGKAEKTIFTDVFAYRDGKWQAVNAQELPLNESTHP